MTRLLVVDDHPVVREGVTAIFSTDPDLRVVGQAESGERAIAEAERLLPDIVLLDMRLPGMSGAETCKSLLSRFSHLGVIMLTSFPHAGTIVSAFTAGAKGFLLKESEPRVFREAVRAVSQGATYTDPKISAKMAAIVSRRRRAKGPFGLTQQEMRVVEMLPRGLTNKEIGEELGLTHNTIKTHMRHALQKLGAKDRAEAAATALRKGLA